MLQSTCNYLFQIQDLTLFERMKKHKEHTINSIDKLQPELGNLALFGLERSDGDLSWNWWNVGEIISGINKLPKKTK